MMLESKHAIEARPQVYSFLRNDKSCALLAPMMIVVHGATALAITKVLECKEAISLSKHVMTLPLLCLNQSLSGVSKLGLGHELVDRNGIIAT